MQYLNVVGGADRNTVIVHIRISPTDLRPLHVVKNKEGNQCYYHTGGWSSLVSARTHVHTHLVPFETLCSLTDKPQTHAVYAWEPVHPWDSKIMT